MPPDPNLAVLRDQRFVEGVLAHLPLLAGVAQPLVTAMARRCSILDARRGEVIVRRQARIPGIYVVAYGSVKLVLPAARRDQRVLRLVGGGQSFAEAHALIARPCDFDALAMAQCKLLLMPIEAVLQLTERDAHFARNLMTTLAHRLVHLLGTFEAATVQRGAQRLASYLETLAGPNGSPGRTVVSLPVTKTVVAAQLGVKKETLSRLLRQFVARGVIEVSRREIAILDRAALVAAATTIEGVRESAAYDKGDWHVG